MRASSPKGYTLLVSLSLLLISLTGSGFAATKGLTKAYFLQPYSASLQPSFGTPPYTFQLTSGSLPSGLTMDQHGNITGTPSNVCACSFQVLATRPSQPPQQQTFGYSLAVVVGSDLYGGLPLYPPPEGAPVSSARIRRVGDGTSSVLWEMRSI